MKILPALVSIPLISSLLFACSERRKPEPPPPPVPVASEPAAPPQEPPEYATATGSDYVPAEFKTGAARWKDTIVYVDGRPRGSLSFGELPVPLEVYWKEERGSAEMKTPDDPGYVIVKRRRYRFVDYLEAIGVDLKAVKAIHVYGPKQTDSIVATGDELRSKAGRELLFRFGSEVQGKALPHAPEGFGNGRTPDKITSVMVYLKRTPPTLVPNEGYFLDGAKVEGVPYFGEPLRGGVRVYLDNKMVAIIKRQELRPEDAETLPDGTLRWKLATFLKANGVSLDGVTQAWIIRNDRREEVLTGADVTNATFEASPQAKGEVAVGKLRAQAIALHTKPISKADISMPLPDEGM